MEYVVVEGVTNGDFGDAYFLNESDRWFQSQCVKIGEVLAIVFLVRSGGVFFSGLFEYHSQVIMLLWARDAFFCHFWELTKSAIKKETLVNNFRGYFSSFFDIYVYSSILLGTQPALDMGFARMSGNRKERISRAIYFVLKKIEQPTRKQFFQVVYAEYPVVLSRMYGLVILEKLIKWIGINWTDFLLYLIFNIKKWCNLRGMEQVGGFGQIIMNRFFWGRIFIKDICYFFMDTFYQKDSLFSESLEIFSF